MSLKRLDQILVLRQLAESRTRAQALIETGRIQVNGITVTKAASQVSEDASITVIDPHNVCPFVSRGGIKLEHALQIFGIDVSGRVCLDVGASTGGFTHCLLLRGARYVHAVDVGYGQLHWTLRTDPRVGVHERTHIKDVTCDMLVPPPEIAVMDVSFISILKVIPYLQALLPPNALLVSLIKPQFEVGKGKVGKGGVVRDPDVRIQTVQTVLSGAEVLGCTRIAGPIESPITGPAGNIEYLAAFQFK